MAVRVPVTSSREVVRDKRPCLHCHAPLLAQTTVWRVLGTELAGSDGCACARLAGPDGCAWADDVIGPSPLPDGNLRLSTSGMLPCHAPWLVQMAVRDLVTSSVQEHFPTGTFEVERTKGCYWLALLVRW